MANALTPKLIPLFESSLDDLGIADCYQKILWNDLKRVLPSAFFESREEHSAAELNQKKILSEALPLVLFFEDPASPKFHSFFALAKYRPNAFKFFFEMISRWIVPGKRLNVVLLHASDFRLPELTDEIYTLCQVKVILEDEDIEKVTKNFPALAAEIAFGIQSEFYAQRILEIKGLSLDEKTISVQGSITSLLKRYPHIYDKEVFKEMQHLLVASRDEFKAARDSRHLSRLISLQYLFRKMLREAIKKHSHRRHLNLKIFRTFIHTGSGKKKVLGIIVGVNFFREQETFGEKHLLMAIKHFIPSAKGVEHSFFMHKLGGENMGISYLEVEKEDGAEFSVADIRKLRRELPISLKNRVESSLHDIFMPRNEEEIMRHMLSLSQQIKYVRDIPQIIINFESQSHSHLNFTIILGRILRNNTTSIAELLKLKSSNLKYVIDRVKILGLVRKKHPKEMSVCRLKLLKEDFLRPDHSIDLYKARQTVFKEFVGILGEVRDYNGGMLSKEQELLGQIRGLLAGVREYDDWLLENFFYSLSPVVVRALLDPHTFKIMFCMLLDGLKEYKQEPYLLKIHTEEYNIYAVAIGEDGELKEVMDKALENLKISNTDLIHGFAKTHGNLCVGCVCCAKEVLVREKFFQGLQEELQNWSLSKARKEIVERISI